MPPGSAEPGPRELARAEHSDQSMRGRSGNSEMPADLVRTLRTAYLESVVARPRELLR
jgi:hypothetical protein